MHIDSGGNGSVAYAACSIGLRHRAESALWTELLFVHQVSRALIWTVPANLAVRAICGPLR